MFDVPIDATYYWLGLAVVSLAVLGVATDLPTQPPPDAPAAANTVDAIAASDYPGTATHPLNAERVRVTAYGIGLRGDGGTTHATFAFGPVTPTPRGSALAAVARGSPPAREFDDPASFAEAAQRARTASVDDGTDAASSSTPPQTASWQTAPDALLVRNVNWGDVHVTLVLA